MTQEKKDKIIKELQEKLAEAEKIKVDEPKCWKPKYGETYWVVYSSGIIGDVHWGSDPDDNWRYLTSNCFKTKEEAEEHKNQIEYTARYKNYIEEHSEPLDWENEKQCKYLVEFTYNGHRITVSDYYALKKQGAIYASSPEIIRNAIKEIGEDNFKKYVLGVK